MADRTEAGTYADDAGAVADTDIRDNALFYVVFKNDSVADKGDDPFSDSAVIGGIFFYILAKTEPCEGIVEVAFIFFHELRRKVHEQLFGL